jgi:kynurenine formamidase
MKTKKIFIAILGAFLLVTCKREVKKNANNTFVLENIENATLVDLSHSYSRETIYWVTSKEFELDTVFNGKTENGYYYSANNFATAEHGGTHIDAPIHFAKGAETVDQIPLRKLIGSAIKIDVRSKTKNNPDYLISIDDLKAWEEKHGMQIPKGIIILLQTGFSEYYPDKTKYMGTDQRGNEAVKLLHFPGLDPAAASWLINNRKIHSIGIDTPSIDYGQSQYFKTHVALMTHNIPAFENLNHLEQLPEKDFTIIALPMKIKGGTGAPLRIIAVLK